MKKARASAKFNNFASARCARASAKFIYFCFPAYFSVRARWLAVGRRVYTFGGQLTIARPLLVTKGRHKRTSRARGVCGCAQNWCGPSLPASGVCFLVYFSGRARWFAAGRRVSTFGGQLTIARPLLVTKGRRKRISRARGVCGCAQNWCGPSLPAPGSVPRCPLDYCSTRKRRAGIDGQKAPSRGRYDATRRNRSRWATFVPLGRVQRRAAPFWRAARLCSAKSVCGPSRIGVFTL